MKLFDTHSHLNARQYKGKVQEVYDMAIEAGVGYFGVVGFDLETNQRSIDLVPKFENTISVIGWHPTVAKDYNSEVEKKINQWLDLPQTKMLGEVGLDYHWDTSPRDIQEKVFRRMINIAKDHDLPITIHERDASDAVYKILKEEGIPRKGGIMHTFGNDVEDAKRYLDLGMHLSFSGVVTFKNTAEVREAAKIVPLDRLLIETDAPYLTPVPYRGKMNYPAYVTYVAEKLAEVKELPLEKIARATTLNAFKLFDWYPEQDKSEW